ncbi:RND family transporter [Caballeronia novacaledonica]|uniref:RND family transporter n=1 Tax=Caballeronia novacaledonica TaxID=1544861 RepID=A0AA37MS84_9BURK|nr:MMPL family transporter [Caballeronia novacaledonica]GJH29386.1 RND family transporter [Caballeronia novacaledonica]
MNSAQREAPSQPVVESLDAFDRQSGSPLERLLFNRRAIVVALCVLVTLVLGFQATRVTLNASFEDTLPTHHPFIQNYLKNRGDLQGLGNAVRVVVEAPKHKDGSPGSIYDANYLATLAKINDEIFLLPGVDRPFMKSIWTPNMRWVAVTEDGLDGGPVIPDDYDASSHASIEHVRVNVQRSGEIGTIVAQNGGSSVIYVPLLASDPKTGKPIDYAQFSRDLEKIRSNYQAQGVAIHVTGFAKVVGDLIDGLKAILAFFGAAVVIACVVLYGYTRCLRSTLLVVTCSLVAVVWQLGLLPTLGFELDPYSVLVPFLVFAIGMSHGAQKMNGIMQDIGRGTHKLVAARYTFRRLFLAGFTALLCDAVGFAVLMLIRIPVIQSLALIASVGVAVLIFTNLVLLPILLSYTGVSKRAALRTLRAEQIAAEAEVKGTGARKHPLWSFLDLFTQRKFAAFAIVVAALLAAGGYTVSRHLQVGDLDPGAPELRADSRYNRDVAFTTANYGASTDVFAVMVKSPDGACSSYRTAMLTDALEWKLRQVKGVESTRSLADYDRTLAVGLNEGNAKWAEVVPSQGLLNTIAARAPREMMNEACNTLTVLAYLHDHKASTLSSVVAAAQQFADDNDSPDARFLLAAGTSGFDAATNIVVEKANREMLFWVYAAVIVLCLVTFRSWRGVLCAVLPLMLTSVLCEALMVGLGIGVKVATLPVIALGVGIGVDYALYVMSITLARLREGKSLSEAYYSALLFTGRVVLLTGVTLALGVATWIFSPIKFQTDMGMLLAFMFLWNMLGALILLPALAYFLFPASLYRASATSSEAQQRTEIGAEEVNGTQPPAPQRSGVSTLF